MKHEQERILAQGAFLGFCLAFGAVGCMVTGLNLTVSGMLRLALLSALGCLAGALLSRVRYGGWIVSGIFLISAAALLRSEEAMAQTVDMLCRISNFYDNAYGWGWVASPRHGRGLMDGPLGLLALWIALANCWALCRGEGGISGLLLAALPVAACVVVTDTVPREGYLYLWMLGTVLVLLSISFRRRNPAWGVNMVLLAAIPTALALGLLFWAVPREGYDKHPEELGQQAEEFFETLFFDDLPELWDRITGEVAEKVDGTVQPETINLQNTGPRIKRVYPVMEVTAPVSGTVYLRGQHYDIYTGTGWQTAQGREAFPLPKNTRELGTVTISTRNVRDVVYLPYYPDYEPNLFDGRIDNSQREKVYSFTQLALFSHWRNTLLSASSTMEIPYFSTEWAKNSTDGNLHLPEDTYRWAVEMVADILTDEVSATDVADTIAGFVRNSALYDLDTEKMPWESGDFAKWFLEESETGYCVHFATAATVLLRAAGVEARYVEGYMFTTRMGQETTVTADQAHAWAEYYEPLLDAWIVLEATPSDLNGEEQSTETTGEETEAPPELPDRTEPSETSPDPEDDPKPSGTGGDRTEEKREKPDLGWLWTVLKWILTPVGVVLAAEGQRRLRLQRRNSLRRRGSARQRALRTWQELERLCVLTKTEAPEQARFLAEKAKYSRQGLSAEELGVLTAHLQEAVAALEGRDRFHRLLDRYLFALY